MTRCCSTSAGPCHLLLPLHAQHKLVLNALVLAPILKNAVHSAYRPTRSAAQNATQNALLAAKATYVMSATLAVPRPTPTAGKLAGNGAALKLQPVCRFVQLATTSTLWIVGVVILCMWPIVSNRSLPTVAEKRVKCEESVYTAIWFMCGFSVRSDVRFLGSFCWVGLRRPRRTCFHGHHDEVRVPYTPTDRPKHRVFFWRRPSKMLKVS